LGIVSSTRQRLAHALHDVERRRAWRLSTEAACLLPVDAHHALLRLEALAHVRDVAGRCVPFADFTAVANDSTARATTRRAPTAPARRCAPPRGQDQVLRRSTSDSRRRQAEGVQLQR